MTLMVKSLPAVQETWVGSLDWEDPPGEGNGYPLQYSCVENPMDRGACGYSSRGHKESNMTERLIFLVNLCFPVNIFANFLNREFFFFSLALNPSQV